MVRAPEFPSDAQWLMTSGEEPSTAIPSQRSEECSVGGLSLAELRGGIVVLDFWTYGCINCLHMLPELAALEATYGDRITLLGIHSAKFDHEAEPAQVQQALRRYGIRHPVLCDRDFQVWQQYAIRAWPTVVVIDARGYIAGQFVGEGRGEQISALISKLLSQNAGGSGTTPSNTSPAITNPTSTNPTNTSQISRLPEPTRHCERSSNSGLSASSPRELSFPGNICVAQPNHAEQPYLFIADSSNHRIVITTLTGQWIDSIGTGASGWTDGPGHRAQFCYPQGMAWDDATQQLYIADSGNHVVRVLNWQTEMQAESQEPPGQLSAQGPQVRTIAGTGQQSRFLHPHGGQAKAVALNSPWDLALVDRHLFIAMAGTHQIWRLALESGQCETYAGSGAEGWADGALLRAAFAQPSGLATDGNELFVADAETSSIRAVGLGAVELGKNPQVRTVCGSGMLFGWGDRDGSGEDVRLQHCLGLSYHQGFLWVADTYNHRIKRVNPNTGDCQTHHGTGQAGYRDGLDSAAMFAEPSGMGHWEDSLLIADTNNHRIRRIEGSEVRSLDLHTPISPPLHPHRSIQRL